MPRGYHSMVGRYRRVCWPEPDATCLNGGCAHCDDHPYRAVTTILRYARAAGELAHRDGEIEDAWSAFWWGYRHGLANAASHTRRVGRKRRTSQDP